MVARHDAVVEAGERVDRVCFFGDEEEHDGDEDHEERDEERGDEVLEDVGEEFVVVEEVFLSGGVRWGGPT